MAKLKTEDKKELPNYLILPETASHPDLLIAEEVTYHNHTYKKTHELLKQRNIFDDMRFILPPNLFVEFLKMCRTGKAFNELGKKVNPKRLENLLEERLSKRDPERSEWLNHEYSLEFGTLQVSYPKFVNGKLIKITEPLDEDTFIGDVALEKNDIEILEDWLNNSTSQGLPRKSIQKYLSNSFSRAVPFFSADSRYVGICFSMHPENSHDWRGVRPAKILKNS